jgi:hypothetical protein
LDLAKAFDTVSHSILLKKLTNMGIGNGSYTWIKSYIANRTQEVRIGEEHSGMRTVGYGVPQGSILGPTLFLMYINGLYTDSDIGEAIAFADDTVLIYGGNTWSETFAKAHEGLQRAKKWMDYNLLTLNTEKTKYTTFSIDGRQQPQPELTLGIHDCTGRVGCGCTCPTLERVDCYKYLGVYIDKHLRWDSHVDQTLKKCRKMIYVFKILRDVFNTRILRTIYFAMVQSILEYGIIGWGGMSKTLLQPLERAQRLVIKVMYRRCREYPTEELHRESGFLTIRQLYVRTILTYIHNEQSNFQPNHVLTHNTRSRSQLRPPHTRTSFAQRNYTFLAPRMYNIVIPQLGHIVNARNLKTLITRWLRERGGVETSQTLLNIIV